MQQKSFQTRRILLSPWELSDAEELRKLWADEGFREFSNFQALDLAEAQEEIRTRLQPNRKGFGFWKVSVPEVAGVMQLKNQTLDDGRVLPEMGYRLARAHWGKGYATEAAQCLRDYVFRDLNVSPLYLFIDPQNLRSQAVAKRLGFEPGESAKFKGFDVVLWSSRA